MKLNHIKLTIVAVAAVLLAVITLFNVTATRTTANEFRSISNDDAETAATYKSKCAMCHTAKADKFFDPAKPIEAHTQVILKGVPTSKPPMPGYETKGITAEQAKSLAQYMLNLKNPGGSNSNTANNTNSNNTNSNTTNSNTGGQTKPSDEQVAATYKSKCTVCHSPKAEKFFDPSKKDEDLVTVTLEGKATAKPPMPAYKTKGMTNEEALALVAYMKGLRDAKK